MEGKCFRYVISHWTIAFAVVVLLSTHIGDAEKTVTAAKTNTIDTIVDSVLTTVLSVASSQCQHVKRLLGVDYDETKEEPDMSKLTVDYITKERTIVYNLTNLSTIITSNWFNPNNSLILYFPGFTDNPSGKDYRTISKEFFARGDFNIMAVNASIYVRWHYLRATTLVVYIGEALGTAMVNMTEAGLNSSSIYLVGHSLGCHMASYTAKTLYKLTGSKVGRITGLDPAGPCYSDLNSSLRLNKFDADYVDVVHTNAGMYGLNADCGDKDYYPNGGSHQPGCGINQSCSHRRAWKYYTESVLNITGFPAVSCANWTTFQNGTCDNNNISYMGYASEAGTDGEFYLKTAADSPYALGTDGI